MHSICPKLSLISQIYPQIWLFLLVFGRNFHHISKLAQFVWVIIKENICPQWFKAKMQPERQQLEWTRQIFAHKLPKIANIPIQNVIIEVLFNFSPYFLCFTKKEYLGSMISSKKVVIEPTAGVNEAKIWPTFAKMCYIPIQKHNQIQTQLH